MAKGCTSTNLPLFASVVAAACAVYWGGVDVWAGMMLWVGGDYFQKHGLSLCTRIGVGVIITYITTAWARQRARRDWEAEEFLKAVQISLNYIADEDDDGDQKLRFRTLDECGVDQLMNMNSAGINKILSAAKLTTCDDPFIR